MTPAQKTLRLVLGDQLNEKHSWFQQVDKNITYVMMEIRQETDYVNHHIQKVLACFAAMRAFAERLRNKGHRVIYLKLDDPGNRQRLGANIRTLLDQHNIGGFEYLLPDEYRLDSQFKELAKTLPVTCHATDTEHFLAAREDLAQLLADKKRYLMESFYRWMRQRYGILMEAGKPVGGQWNFDKKNRETYRGQVPLPKPLFFNNDVRELYQMIQRHKVKTIGNVIADGLIWPVNRDQSLALLRHFVEEALPAFGTYQDAMTTSSWQLFHCRLSFSLNSKMLSPMEVIAAALQAWENHPAKIGIQQIEGFIRQILGWREYMRGIYWTLMPDLSATNFFDHRAPLPEFFWTGNTRMNCLKHAIDQSLDHAYAHHIQRLMVTGNFALLAGIDPDAVDEWYLGIYIDAVEWVEMPNTRAMSQFADGGRVATKPYVSTARYIHAMSDYCNTCTYDRGKRHGKSACPFNSLYWHFFHRNRRRLKKIPRIGMMFRTWDRMEKQEQSRILQQAETYRNRLDRL